MEELICKYFKVRDVSELKEEQKQRFVEEVRATFSGDRLIDLAARDYPRMIQLYAGLRKRYGIEMSEKKITLRHTVAAGMSGAHHEVIEIDIENMSLWYYDEHLSTHGDDSIKTRLKCPITISLHEDLMAAVLYAFETHNRKYGRGLTIEDIENYGKIKNPTRCTEQETSDGGAPMAINEFFGMGMGMGMFGVSIGEAWKDENQVGGELFGSNPM